jgi:hypothetical protein
MVQTSATSLRMRNVIEEKKLQYFDYRYISIDSQIQRITCPLDFSIFLLDSRNRCYATTTGIMVSRQKYLRQQQSVVRRVSGTAKPLCLTPRRRARKYRLPCPMSSNNQGTSMDDEIYRVLDEELCFGRIKNKSFLGGSSWSSCLLIETDDGHQVFAKIALGKPSSLMFQGEALGLKAMYGALSQYSCVQLH